MAYILLVDDDKGWTIKVTAQLTMMSHEVKTIHDGREAIEAIKAREPEILLLDLLLPFIDGGQILEKVRDALPHNKISVIMLMPMPADNYVTLNWDAPITNWILKPCNPLQVYFAVDQVLHRHVTPIQSDISKEK